MSTATETGPRPPTGEGPDTPAAAVEAAPYPLSLYFHVIVVSLIGALGVLAWFAAYEVLNRLVWDNSFVTENAWTFPVVCIPFSLIVGLLVKYARAPSNLDDSLLDSLTGDVTHLRWKDLPATVATSIASLLSGAVLGPEGAIGNIAEQGRRAVLRPVPGARGPAPQARLRQRLVGLQRPAREPCLRRRARHGDRRDQAARACDLAGQPHRRRRGVRRVPARAERWVCELPPPAPGAELRRLGRDHHGAAGAGRPGAAGGRPPRS